MSSTTTAGRPRARWAFLALLGALLLLALVQALPAQAATYTGGPQAGFYPLYVSNDHSVYAVRIEATGGLATGTYYVKIRISPTATPSGGTSRGFTWNPTANAGLGAWVQERADWSEFPTVTTDASGYIVGGNQTWYYFKFGDTTKPTSSTPNPWYLVVSLQPKDGGSGTTQNNLSAPAVTIMDSLGTMPDVIDSFRIHNGIDDSTTGAGKRVEAAAAGSEQQTNVWSLSRTENNNVDDGNTETAGDFGLAVPVGLAFDVKIQSNIWPDYAGSFTGTVTNADIAYAATDTTPPDAPSGFTKTMEGTTAHLSWNAVSDADSYNVYMWQDATPIGGATNYTPLHVKIDTVTATTYDKPGLVEGQTYHFEVRAVDTAGNLSSPSTYPSALTLTTTATTVDWGGQATLSGTLTDGNEDFSATQQVIAESSTDGTTWTELQALDPGTSFAYSLAVTPEQATQYRFVFTGDGVHASAVSPIVTVTPRVKLGKPAAPSTVKKGKKFTVYGSLAPKQNAGTKTVQVKCYKKVSGKWRLKKTVTATNRDYKGGTRYSVKLALSSRGSWKLVASFAATAKYAKTVSKAEFLKVK